MSSITTLTSALSLRSSPGMNAVRLSFTKALICPEIQEHIPIFFIRLSSCVCKIMEMSGPQSFYSVHFEFTDCVLNAMSDIEF